MEMFSETRFPLTVALEPAPLSAHWLFCCVPLPGVMDPVGCAPVSVSRTNVFCARLYRTAHPAVREAVELTSSPTVVKSAADRGSETCRLNICWLALPAEGLNETAT